MEFRQFHNPEQIKPQDRVMVVNASPCCKSTADLGKTFTVKRIELRNCYCSRSDMVYRTPIACGDTIDDEYPCVMLKKLPPVSAEDEEFTASTLNLENTKLLPQKEPQA